MHRDLVRAAPGSAALASLVLLLGQGCGGKSHQTSSGAGGDGATGGTAGRGGESATGGTGGQGGQGGQGGSGASGGTGGGTGGVACPGLGGPSMVSVGGFCIDSTEVTQGQYRAWLATNPSVTGQTTACAWNATFLPPDSCAVNSVVCPWQTGSCNDSPQVCVDWCDAQAYCRAVGKRLCGAIAGGTADYGDLAAGQWRTACGGVYPYGDQYVAGACHDGGVSPIGAIAVGSSPGCVVVYDGHPIFDMSGNVSEWEDSCSANTDASDDCRARGGSFWDPPDLLECESPSKEVLRRDSVETYVGFRCCS